MNQIDSNHQNKLDETFAAFYSIMQIIFTMHILSRFPWEHLLPSGSLFSCCTLWTVSENRAGRWSLSTVEQLNHCCYSGGWHIPVVIHSLRILVCTFPIVNDLKPSVCLYIFNGTCWKTLQPYEMSFIMRSHFLALTYKHVLELDNR